MYKLSIHTDHSKILAELDHKQPVATYHVNNAVLAILGTRPIIVS